MPKTVVIVGTLDTKGAELAFVKDLIEAQGLEVLVVDFGVMGVPAMPADVSRQEVALAASVDLSSFQSGDRKDEAMQAMASGLAIVISNLHGEGRLDGVLGMGGTGGTSIAAAAMRQLPVGVPKVMISTVGGGDVSDYCGTKDITFVPSIVDVSGFNRISRAMYANGAGAIAGMVKLEAPAVTDDKPLIAASMFGNTTTAVDHARGLIEQAGYEVLVFHATGTGGRTMEDLISEGHIAGAMDITTTEVADFVCGGVFSAGPDRCLAAAQAGIPTVLAPGCVDMANFDGVDSVPDKYKGRTLYEWNPNVTLLRTNVEENRQIGRLLATAANTATAPVVVMLPLKGVSMLDAEGGAFWDPEADSACFETIKQDLKPDIPVIEMDVNINDPAFSRSVADHLLELLNS